MVVEHGQRGVQVIEPWVDQLEGDHRQTKHRGDFGVCALVCAKAVARQHPFANHQQVALSLVDVAGGHRAISDRGHPAGIGSRLTSSFGEPEPGDHGDVVRDEPTVGGVHHVR
ncbi:Uncharacterised protein [Mycobacterium tuberculosis]|uniref:Uncharacterized protein n=1 Tax=Mycobacterium tuberculosis TaxID=1773 RepID=A0A654ZK46_MYCTX|nr:Uncharacterised protein [Mycobacterium tuberculosis]CKP45446.1 Uncharacterised protein [Mycobacterium tuberculosis]CKS56858.1 Uncharacterised protein [Mycobacterium tuberculosis]CKT05914.1 Uncharacterised protein [Mycobacterium tuberculosis]CKW16900.1 Uncharacterised protein [Mycobacterium tuberculosis]